MRARFRRSPCRPRPCRGQRTGAAACRRSTAPSRIASGRHRRDPTSSRLPVLREPRELEQHEIDDHARARADLVVEAEVSEIEERVEILLVVTRRHPLAEAEAQPVREPAKEARLRVRHALFARLVAVARGIGAEVAVLRAGRNVAVGHICPARYSAVANRTWWFSDQYVMSYHHVSSRYGSVSWRSCASLSLPCSRFCSMSLALRRSTSALFDTPAAVGIDTKPGTTGTSCHRQRVVEHRLGRTERIVHPVLEADQHLLDARGRESREVRIAREPRALFSSAHHRFSARARDRRATMTIPPAAAATADRRSGPAYRRTDRGCAEDSSHGSRRCPTAGRGDRANAG